MSETPPTENQFEVDLPKEDQLSCEKRFENLETRFSESRWQAVSKIPLSRTMLVAIGFAVGASTLVYDYALSDPYLKTTPFQLYALSVICQTVFGAVALGSMAPALWNLKCLAWRNPIETFLWLGLFAVLIDSSKYFAADCPAYNFRNHSAKTFSLTITVGSVALLAGLGSILVNIGLRELLPGRRAQALDKEKADAELVSRYLRLRGHLLHFLSVVGILLGLVGVAQSAKRYMILNSTSTPATATECILKVPGVASWLETTNCLAQGYYCVGAFDLKKVFVYGLYYTVILVLTFLPTFSTLIATGHQLRDDILPIPSPHSEEWSSSCAKRAKLEKMLSLSWAEGLRALIAVLAPVLGTLISLLSLVKK